MGTCGSVQEEKLDFSEYDLSNAYNLSIAVGHSWSADVLKYKINEHYKHFPDKKLKFSFENDNCFLLQTAIEHPRNDLSIIFYIMQQGIQHFTNKEYYGIMSRLSFLSDYYELQNIIRKHFPKFEIDDTNDFVYLILRKGIRADTDPTYFEVDPKTLSSLIEFTNQGSHGRIDIVLNSVDVIIHTEEGKKEVIPTSRKTGINIFPNCKHSSVYYLFQYIKQYPRDIEEYKILLYNTNCRELAVDVIDCITKFIDKEEATHIFAAYRAFSMAKEI